MKFLFLLLYIAVALVNSSCRTVNYSFIIENKYYTYEIQMLSLDNVPIQHEEFIIGNDTLKSDSVGIVKFNVDYILTNCNKTKKRICEDILYGKYIVIENGQHIQFIRNKWRRSARKPNRTIVEKVYWPIVVNRW